MRWETILHIEVKHNTKAKIYMHNEQAQRDHLLCRKMTYPAYKAKDFKKKNRFISVEIQVFFDNGPRTTIGAKISRMAQH